MVEIDQRSALARLIAERGEDFASVSKLLGRNPAYIHQFIKRGSPKRLNEEDRHKLAAFFGVADQVLGGPAPAFAGLGDRVHVPRLNVGASAGPGAINDVEQELSGVSFDRNWLRRLCAARPESLSIIRVEGDSMSPTLADGDEIMVNAEDAAARLRDGIYVLRRDDDLVVKRVGLNPASRRITVKSDNPAYPVWPECEPRDIVVIGRVIWASRRIV